MSQYRAGKLAKRTVWLTLAAVFALGCNPLSTVAFLWGDDPVKPAECPLTYDKGPKKGKEIAVALFISSDPSSGPDFAGSEQKLAYDIAKKLPEMCKTTKKPTKLTVLDPSQVNTFKMKNPSWKQMHPSEWGKKLNVDFVLEIQLNKMSLFKSGTLNSIYEGEAEVEVEVYDVEAGPSVAKYQYDLPFKYPHTGFLSADMIPKNRFKQDFLEHLASEICMKHVEHKQASGIADDQ